MITTRKESWQSDVEIDLQLLLHPGVVDEHLALPSPVQEKQELGGEEVQRQRHRAAGDRGARERRFREVPFPFSEEVKTFDVLEDCQSFNKEHAAMCSAIQLA